MEFTCLSKGSGFQFPPCHVLDISGFRILFDCPLDLSALAIFSPVPTEYLSPVHDEAESSAHELSDSESVALKRRKIDKPLDASNLVHAEPWYKTVKNLHLWDVSLIDIVLISSPMGMLGLPFLTKSKGFTAKIYATEATTRIGQFMMEDLVSMHMEFKQFYGPDDGFPHWMKWEELEELPPTLREIAIGHDMEELGGWMRLYIAADVKDCMRKVQTLRYSEEACYNGTLILKAFSSGLEIGACNWTINGPRASITCLSGSISVSGHASDFDFHALQGNDMIIYSDFSPLHSTEDVHDDMNLSSPQCSGDSNGGEASNISLVDPNEGLEEVEKIAFICSSAVDSVEANGSVLITISRIGIVLQIIEQLSVFLNSSTREVPIYVISAVAEELLEYTNTIPEWLCKQRQEKLFSGESLFAHIDLIKDKKVHLFPAIHSPEFLMEMQEPCIIFSPHWSLRLGSSVHFLRRWCGDPSSLLVLENGLDAGLGLLPFQPMEMKVLQCSFLSGIRSQKVQPLLKLLQPKLVLFPESLSSKINISNVNSYSIMHYSENETVHIPSFKYTSEVVIATDLGSKFTCKAPKGKKIDITRLKGELLMDHGKYKLLPESDPVHSRQSQPLVHWGSPDMEKLLDVLSKAGVNASIEQHMGDTKAENNGGIIHVHDPNNAFVEVQPTCTIISAADQRLASFISEAVGSILDGV